MGAEPGPEAKGTFFPGPWAGTAIFALQNPKLRSQGQLRCRGGSGILIQGEFEGDLGTGLEASHLFA